MIVVPHRGCEETVVLFLEHHCNFSIAHSRKRISIRGTSAWKKKRYSSSFPGSVIMMLRQLVSSHVECESSASRHSNSMIMVFIPFSASINNHQFKHYRALALHH